MVLQILEEKRVHVQPAQRFAVGGQPNTGRQRQHPLQGDGDIFADLARAVWINEGCRLDRNSEGVVEVAAQFQATRLLNEWEVTKGSTVSYFRS